jgi:long-chain acyl-CoA synthetase
MPNLVAFLTAQDDAPRHSILLQDTGSTITPWALPALPVANGLASLNAGSPPLANNCGQCLPVVEARIADNGELLLRGLALSQGYWNNPAAKQADMQLEGWVYTGCLARLEGVQIMMNGALSGTTVLDTQPAPATPLSLTQSTVTH